MGGMFSKPKAPDNSKQEAELARQKQEAEERTAKSDREKEEREARMLRGRRGRQGLIATSGTGVSTTKTG